MVTARSAAQVCCLVNSARLLLKKCKIMLRIEDELVAIVDAHFDAARARRMNAEVQKSEDRIATRSYSNLG